MRGYLNRLTKYQGSHRDRIIEYQGILATIETPVTEDDVDEFGDIKQGARNTSQVKVIPRYNHYYDIINLFGGANIEQDLPLEIIAKISDYIPNDSILILPTCKPDDSSTEDERWRVTSSEIKYLEKLYTRILRCVPYREKVGP